MANDQDQDQITETIVINMAKDMLPSQIAKVIRQMATVGHALVSNVTRFAAIRERAEVVGMGFPVYQQVSAATANLDAAANSLEQGQRQVLAGGLPPHPGSGFGRA